MNALEIRNVTKTYPNFTLNHLDLTLPNGCIMGLIGENGAGKSTTIKLILDMIEKDSGTIRIFGADHEQNLSLTKQDLGVVLDEVGFPQCLNAKQMEKNLEVHLPKLGRGMYTDPFAVPFPSLSTNPSGNFPGA